MRDANANIDLEVCVPCLAQVFLAPVSAIGPMPGGGWGFHHTGTATTDTAQDPKPEYEALCPDDAALVLLETAQGKYHRTSYQERIAALEKDGLFLCRRK